MKIKIVVRPEDEQRAAAAAEASRQSRRKRARWGIAALLGLVALSAAVALFFIGRGSVPGDGEEPPVAAAPAPAGSARSEAPGEAMSARPGTRAVEDDRAEERGAASVAAGTAPASGSEPAASEVAPAGEGGADAALRLSASPEASSETTEGGVSAGGVSAGGAAAGLGDDAEPSPPGGLPQAEETPSPQATRLPEAPSPRSAAQGEAAKAPVVAKVPAKPEPGVIRAQLASGVAGREPVGVVRSPVEVGSGGRTVFYFNEFRNLGGQTVTHRWEYQGRVVARIPIRIEGNRWRAYSSKRIGENQLGDWRVSAIDRSGAVLAKADFRAE